MKKQVLYVVLMALLMGSQMGLSAQNATPAADAQRKEKRQRPTPEQMTQMQTNRMLKVLMLDDATATKFTKVYGNYLNELRECRTTKRRRPKQGDAAQEAKKPPVLTDEAIAKILKNRFAQSRKMLDIREKYYNEFSKILTQKQIMKIYEQERKTANGFKKEFDRRGVMKKYERAKKNADRVRRK